jgi:hypothetical protein
VFDREPLSVWWLEAFVAIVLRSPNAINVTTDQIIGIKEFRETTVLYCRISKSCSGVPQSWRKYDSAVVENSSHAVLE